MEAMKLSIGRIVHVRRRSVDGVDRGPCYAAMVTQVGLPSGTPNSGLATVFSNEPPLPGCALFDSADEGQPYEFAWHDPRTCEHG